MKLFVGGSRKGFSKEMVHKELNTLYPDGEGVEKLLSGGACGVDKFAEDWAAKNGVPVKILKAQWGKYGKSAGVLRTRRLLKEAEFVVLFWDGQSKGTGHTIDMCTEFGLDHSIYFSRVKD